MVNESVYIPHLNVKGRIIHLPDKHDMVRIQVNGVTLKLNLSELTLILPAKKVAKQKKQSNIPKFKMSKLITLMRMKMKIKKKMVILIQMHKLKL